MAYLVGEGQTARIRTILIDPTHFFSCSTCSYSRWQCSSDRCKFTKMIKGNVVQEALDTSTFEVKFVVIVTGRTVQC